MNAKNKPRCPNCNRLMSLASGGVFGAWNDPDAHADDDEKPMKFFVCIYGDCRTWAIK